MSSVFKPKGSDRYVIVYKDANGKRRKKTGTHDKSVTERRARELENQVYLRVEGLIDPKAEAYRDNAAVPLADHLTAWAKSIEAKGATSKHVELFTGRARRVVAILMGAKLVEIEPAKNEKHVDIPKFEATLAKWVASARLSDLTADRVQGALATLKREGRALATCNHHRAAVKAFSLWLYDSRRAKEDVLRGVTGFNAKEDRRHDRRTVSIEELHKLIDAARRGSEVMGMSGQARALCYRLAVATGLRYAEIGTIEPEAFNWEAPSVTVAAAYTKNGEPATLPLPVDLVSDLRAYVATVEARTPIFPLPVEKGAKMLRVDLEAAGIPYRDGGGLVFDFHSLRCEMATLADAAGVSPRVVQRMMRHSSLELTGRYTRPRAIDIEAATGMMPSLKPVEPETEAEALEATGTDGRNQFVTFGATEGNVDGCNSNGLNVFEPNSGGLIIRRSGVRVASPVLAR